MYRSDNGPTQSKSSLSLSLSPTDVLSILPPEITSPSGFAILFRTANRYFQVWRTSTKHVLKIEEEVDLTAGEGSVEQEDEVRKYAKTRSGRKASGKKDAKPE